ncbi:hypothetical protein JG688_00005734 [Phytophthora aleatoria]|uniref:RING-type domain-containing protein n=1 Tax=Phytophthora aleatoria TaxID=2496075 RepID=A0A8J5IZE3_9STRA|nr:hypothetical protein JG688_00005734 [Phytophthora aleatoria]
MTATSAPPPTYNSFASRKRSSPAVMPLPEDVAWLKDIKLEMTTTNSIRAAVKYNLRVDYHPAGFTATHWGVKRTFDQYKAFQKRLLRQLQPKHNCKAECRWLYNTVKKHFPKPTLLSSHCPPIVDQRCKALLQLLTTVQASVVNHGNRNCKVMMEAVSQELAVFLVGDDNQSADSVAWLDHLTLELNTDTAGGKTQYQLTMKYTPNQQKLESCATWTVSRSFDEYRAFQKRLLKRMQHGHSCGAECKWLYKVVKHYFPQKSLFCNNCPKVVAARQQTLIRCLTTVQASLVNRGNQSCRVLVHDVAAEFNRFVVKGMKDLEANAHGHFCNAGCPWLFSFLSSEFPKKHIFQRNFSPRIVETRREKLLELLTSTLEFLLDRKNHACAVAATDVAKLVAEFLYGEDAVTHFIVESYSESEASTSSNNNTGSQRRSFSVLCGDEDAASHDSSGELSICSVCNGPLVCQVNRLKGSPANSSSRRLSSVYATVLQCGHQFHDECIVPVLNKTLRCPTCHHLEIQ